MNVQFQRFLFVMPDDGEAFIAALAAVTAYINQMQSMNIYTLTTLVCRRSWLVDLLVPPTIRVVESLRDAGMVFDVAVELNVDRAKGLANATSQSAATGFGHLIGLHGVNELVQLRSTKPESDIIILWWGETSKKLYDGIKRINPELRVNVIKGPLDSENIVEHYHLSDDVFLPSVLNAKMVIGVRSVLTYLAACAGRTLVELYPVDEYEKSFFAKWSAAKYFMLPVNRQKIDESYLTLWRFVEQRLRTFCHSMEAVK